MPLKWTLGFAAGLLVAAVACGADGEAAPSAHVIAVLRDYSAQQPGERRAAVVQWNWTEQQKQQAVAFSSIQIVDEGGRGALRLTVTDQLPWAGRDSHRAMPIGPDLLPPAADAVRLRYRVIDGSITVSCGGPTVYFGHSDVHTEPVTLAADGSTAWRTVDLSLHDRLIRNFRRARFARQSPVIYYTRWIQEPLYLNVHAGSVGALLIDRVELVNAGRGRAYPTFAAEQVRPIATIADFDSADALAKAFTGCQEAVDFTGPPRLPRPGWSPPKLSQAAGEGDHRGLLHIEHHGAEEVTFTGIKTDAAPQANAIVIDMRAAHPAKLDELSIDLIVYVAPRDAAFPWAQFAPPESWRDKPEARFDYYLGEIATRSVSQAFYHARRAVPNGGWTRLVVPLADFVCVYGSGEMTAAMMRQQPLDSRNVIAVGLLPSWRQHTATTVMDVDRIDWAQAPGEGSALRSFPQVADVDGVQLVPWRDTAYGGTRQMIAVPNAQPQ